MEKHLSDIGLMNKRSGRSIPNIFSECWTMGFAKASSTDTIRCWNFLGERMKNFMFWRFQHLLAVILLVAVVKKERWTGLLCSVSWRRYSIYWRWSWWTDHGIRRPWTEQEWKFDASCFFTQPSSSRSGHLEFGYQRLQMLFNANPRVIAKGLEKLVKMVKTYDYGEFYPVPQVLVIAPIHIGEAIETSSFASFDQHSYQLSLLLGDSIKEMAQRNEVLFFDASEVAHPSSIDQLHMDKESHEQLSRLFSIVWMFGDRGLLL